VIWDASKKSTVVWDTAQVACREKNVHPMISGQCRARLADGKSVACETVWDAFRREVDGYAPEKVAASPVCLPRYREGGAVLCQEQTGSIPLGVAVDMTPALTPWSGHLLPVGADRQSGCSGRKRHRASRL